MKLNKASDKIEIPEAGQLLEAGKLYLGKTIEYAEVKNLSPMLEGCSSIDRLGLFVHVYSGMEMWQIYYHTLKGEAIIYDGGKY